ncbi:MAG TPA: molybdenum cofactor guanylyltransferase MobA [Noviherbaspirillum sp.]|nr:molybdenum cofactor guanylyltransferase MobA [Noviherbaspirillum sp.]
MTITGLLLAGGRGMRMGGVDKGLQEFRGMPMTRHVLERLARQVDKVAINANQNLDVYRSFGYPVLPDHMGEFPGPLAGLHTGLVECDTAYLATAPCDSPFLPMDLVARLKDALDGSRAHVAFAVTGHGEARQSHPVFCLLKASDALPGLVRYLERGGRRMEAWMREQAAVEVNFPDDDAFRNINTLEELKKLETP